MSETNDCSECGFSDATVSLADVPAALRRFARRYRAPLTRFLPGEDGDALIRTHSSYQANTSRTWAAYSRADHVIGPAGGRVRIRASPSSPGRKRVRGAR